MYEVSFPDRTMKISASNIDDATEWAHKQAEQWGKPNIKFNIKRAITEDVNIIDPADLFGMAVQINGKLYGNLQNIPIDATKDKVISEAKLLSAVQSKLSGQVIKTEIYVPGMLLNFVLE